jgi:hypothetical protein
MYFLFQKKNKLSELPKEERIKAKALMYGAVADMSRMSIEKGNDDE